MFTHASVILAALAGFLLGCTAVGPQLRRMRTEMDRTRFLAEHDPLTGLPNRRAAQRHFQLQVAAGRSSAAVLIDLDGFKAVNDTWGHQAGDAHLLAIGERLAAACRDVGARAFRLAGDEFVVLLPSAEAAETAETAGDPRASAMAVVRDVRAVVAALAVPQDLKLDEHRSVTLVPSASAGIAVPESGDGFSDVLRRADIALYNAKRYGSPPLLYTPDLRHPWSHRHKAVTDDAHGDRLRIAGTIAEQATR
jgi:diguanylate cyclase (GGDEF)-like protein